MKNLVISITLAFIAFYSNGQIIDIGNEFPIKMKEYFVDVEPLGENEKGPIYLLIPYSAVIPNVVGSTRDYRIAQLGDSLELELIEYIKLEQKGNELEFQFAANWQDKIYIFSTFMNHDERKVFLFGQELDKNTLKLDPELFLVSSLDYRENNKYVDFNYSHEISKDQSKLFIRHSLSEKGDLKHWGYKVFDKSLKTPISSHENELQFDKLGIYTYDSYMVSNSGQPYMVAKYFADEDIYNDHSYYKKDRPLKLYNPVHLEPEFEYHIIKLPFKGNKHSDYKVSLSEKFVTEIRLDINNSGTLIVSGIYAPIGRTVGQGVFSMTMQNGASNFQLKSKKEFGMDLMRVGLNKVDNERLTNGYNDEKKGFSNFRYWVDEPVFQNDDSYFVPIEEYQRGIRTENNGKQVTTYKTLLTRNLYVAYFSSKGVIQWIRKVNKLSDGTGLGVFYSSYKIFPDLNNGVQLYYQSITKKNYKGLFGKMVDVKLEKTTINSSGNVENKVIFTQGVDANVVFRPMDFYLQKNGKIILLGFAVSGLKFSYLFGKTK